MASHPIPGHCRWGRARGRHPVGRVRAQARGLARSPGSPGAWTGSGDIAMTDGSREKIRCRASYSVPPSGEKLHIELNCASDSYKVQVISNVVADEGGACRAPGARVTRQATATSPAGFGPGPDSGEPRGHRLRHAAHGRDARCDRQSVAITPQGTDVQTVSIEMRRG